MALTPIEAFRRDGFFSPEHFAVLDAEIRKLQSKLDELADKYAMLLLTTAPERVVKKVMERYE